MMRLAFNGFSGLGIGVLILGVGLIAACGDASDSAGLANSSSATSGAGAGGPSGSTVSTGTGPSSSSSTGTTTSSSSSSSSGGNGEIQPGQLTSGVWDDNLNYDFFKGYLDDYGNLSGAPTLSLQERDTANSGQTLAAKQTLDISLVIDTTSSMADELEYLQAELDYLTTSIGNAYPQAEQRWSLIVYRDHSDAYLTEVHDFTENVQAFRELLADQQASGGGDYPEAPDVALEQAAQQLSWRSDANTARMLFWVADAPHHTQDTETITNAMRALAQSDVHVYPIASSGVDEITELTMRSAAQITGGRYMFLTDDSGIGGEHKEPTIPCYYVTLLTHAMDRMVNIEMQGQYYEPHPDEIIRVGGDLQDGECTLQSGEIVVAY